MSKYKYLTWKQTRFFIWFYLSFQFLWSDSKPVSPFSTGKGWISGKEMENAIRMDDELGL